MEIWDFSIHFFSEAFFVEKQTPQIIFSIQNGEISILNGDFSIQILFRSVLIFFFKQSLQRIFSIQNGEISLLNEDFSIHFFSEVFCFF